MHIQKLIYDYDAKWFAFLLSSQTVEICNSLGTSRGLEFTEIYVHHISNCLFILEIGFA